MRVALPESALNQKPLAKTYFFRFKVAKMNHTTGCDSRPRFFMVVTRVGYAQAIQQGPLPQRVAACSSSSPQAVELRQSMWQLENKGKICWKRIQAYP
jgi:hypothetical protein